MPTVSAPLAFRWAGIAWPLASERVVLTVEAAPGSYSTIRSADGWALNVVTDLPAPVKDEGPLGPVANALRVSAPTRNVAVQVGPVGRSRPGLAAALCVATLRAMRDVPYDWPVHLRPVDLPLELAIQRGTPSAPVPAERLAWLSEHLLLFVDPSAPPPPADHVIAGPDPRLLLEADPAGVFAALTGHGVPDAPTWRAEHLDRALRAAGLVARWPLEGAHHLALVHAGQRDELRAALTAHGLEPADCRLGGPGLQVEA